jgi:hypothetical protein
MISTRTILAVVVGMMIGFAARAFVAPAAAQVRDNRTAVPLPGVTVLPTIYSGSDIGVRITGSDNTIPTGQIVVRINGVWHQVQF